MSSKLDIYTVCGDTQRMKRKMSRSARHRRSYFEWRVVAYLIVIFACAATVRLDAAPQAELWPRWLEHDEASVATVDHTEWGLFLDRYLVTRAADGVNRVRYAAVNAEDRQRLKRYIDQLENVPVSRLNRDEQLAYWTNLYNAVTVDLILDHYPVGSIRDIGISGPVFNRHPWDASLVTVEAEPLSLNDIEHRIMRPIWQDPRIHYVVNCASIGCPNLMPAPFTAANWQQLADQAAHEYINHPRGADFSGRRQVLSSIYDWYIADFGGDISGVIAHLLEYAGPELTREAQQFAAGGYRGRVRFDYDWELNEE